MAKGRTPSSDSSLVASQASTCVSARRIRTTNGSVLRSEPTSTVGCAQVSRRWPPTSPAVTAHFLIAAMIAAIPVTESLGQAFDRALGLVPGKSGVAQAASFARSIVGTADAVDRLHERYAKLPAVHSLNNLSVVIWATLTHPTDFSAAIGEAVSAGWDTDCNGATVGGMLGLAGVEIPEHWTQPWNGNLATGLVGGGTIHVDELSARTLLAAQKVRETAGRRRKSATP